jgi:hypothetical protein
MPDKGAFVGVADHCGWAILVTVTEGGRLAFRGQASRNKTFIVLS